MGVEDREEGLADLHRHLDGSLRSSTLHELAQVQGRELPADLRFRRGMGLQQALARFACTLSLLQETAVVRRVADEICGDAATEGVTTLEIRFAPQLHGGAAPEEVTDAALEGIAGRAGLVLCGLYGEDPAVLEALAELGASRPGVAGIDLAGGPAPDHRWSLADYAPAFRRARELGLGRTAHCGEGRPPGEIRQAMEQLHLQRIGHGTTLADDPRLMELVAELGITVEACITSNWHVGAIASLLDHPLPRWLQAGVRVCVCTDNTLLSDVDAPLELERATRLPGMNAKQLALLSRWGHAGAFPRTKALLAGSGS